MRFWKSYKVDIFDRESYKYTRSKCVVLVAYRCRATGDGRPYTVLCLTYAYVFIKFFQGRIPQYHPKDCGSVPLSVQRPAPPAVVIPLLVLAVFVPTKNTLSPCIPSLRNIYYIHPQRPKGVSLSNAAQYLNYRFYGDGKFPRHRDGSGSILSAGLFYFGY